MLRMEPPSYSQDGIFKFRLVSPYTSEKHFNGAWYTFPNHLLNSQLVTTLREFLIETGVWKNRYQVTPSMYSTLNDGWHIHYEGSIIYRDVTL